MPTLIELMKDPSVVVRDTTAWTVGRICDLLPEAAINELYLNPLLQCLIEGLGAEPRVASNVCWVKMLPLFSSLFVTSVCLWLKLIVNGLIWCVQAFSSLAEAAYEATDAAEDQEEPSTYCLSSSFELIVQKLLETTDRWGLFYRREELILILKFHVYFSFCLFLITFFCPLLFCLVHSSVLSML